jgi:hypothetical protein
VKYVIYRLIGYLFTLLSCECAGIRFAEKWGKKSIKKFHYDNYIQKKGCPIERKGFPGPVHERRSLPQFTL